MLTCLNMCRKSFNDFSLRHVCCEYCYKLALQTLVSVVLRGRA